MNKKEFDEISTKYDYYSFYGGSVSPIEFNKIKKAYEGINKKISKETMVRIYWQEKTMFNRMVNLYEAQQKILNDIEKIYF